ncbi:hypothetical protein HETIRDRAFT_57794 [Heterobasidion irregulare TC 32-1]|uniref:Checkpoint protein n=1 Tax=Heterobasidion irregulare (strain TC 32-1) TaxID=747525 RepID=W4K9Z8_HETIT|nr:uncharacterized protein HETIRDRAFT_57794 [Heterobasidion irregulare TC 32-1]ETW82603.1 hypothetical protein HETIRDRAFT_57794 [Heterobasidion irregulare TC 32-1]
MRFRASIQNVATFRRIIQTVEKLQKKCIIKFNETEMHIICNTDESGVQVWSQIRTIALFTDYRIQSNADNQISLLLSTEALLHALRSSESSSNADDIVMKLAKKRDVAVLSFEILGAGTGAAAGAGASTGGGMKVTHDVRIEVLKPAEVERLREPLCPEPDIHILLPPLLKLRTLVDRLRPMADIVAVRANGAGRLQISAGTDEVKLDLVWEGCTNPRMDGHADVHDGDDADEDKSDPSQMYGVLVHVRSLLKFLNAHVVSTTTIACICHAHCMILYVYIGEVADAGGVLTFYIPAVLDD